MNLEEISTKLKEDLTPRELSQLKQELAGEYGWISTRLGEILKRRPDQWMELREKSTSDKQADRKWDATDDGKCETVYRLQLKAMEKMLSAISTRLRVLEGEANNQF